MVKRIKNTNVNNYDSEGFVKKFVILTIIIVILVTVFYFITDSLVKNNEEVTGFEDSSSVPCRGDLWSPANTHRILPGAPVGDDAKHPRRGTRALSPKGRGKPNYCKLAEKFSTSQQASNFKAVHFRRSCRCRREWGFQGGEYSPSSKSFKGFSPWRVFPHFLRGKESGAARPERKLKV